MGKSLMPLWLLAALAGVVVDAGAQTPPANDNLTNAQPIVGVQGTVTGNNQYATLQVGEPAPVPGVQSGASIWYLWTAPKTNYMSFDTHNSTDPFGNTLDTVMAIYRLPNPASPLILGNLTKVASNDNDTNTASWPGVSRVNFQAIAGTTYLIQLEGKIAAGATNEGYIVLNWGPSVFGGVFSFSTNVYVFGAQDNTLLTANSSIEPSLMNSGTTVTNFGSTANEGQCRVTVVRTGGYSGRMQVDVSIGGGIYTNILSTNYWGTNVFIETVSTNLGASGTNYTQLAGTGSTNYITINTNSINILQYDNDGTIATYAVSNYAVFMATNTTIYLGGNPVTVAQSSVTNYPGSNAPVVVLNTIFSVLTTTNFDATGTNALSYVLVTTNIFYTNQPPTAFPTPSSSDGGDFLSSDYQTVTFDDYQMSKDVFFNVINESTGPDDPDIYGHLLAPGIPRLSIFTLLNPRLDPLESLDVAAPILAPAVAAVGVNGSVARMDIEDFTIQPINPATGVPNLNTPSVGVINFERRTFRCNKPPLYSTNTVVTIEVYRENPPPLATTVTYTINNLTSPLVWSQAQTISGLEAGSDNAIGQLAANTVPLGNYDFTLPYQAPSPGSGTLSWGMGQGGARTINIINNNNGAVEFDMEYSITLTGTSDPPAPPVGGDVIGNIGTANVTIQFDNNYTDVSNNITHQQPGGAADRNWNKDNVADSFPPFNTLPGANYEVEAIAVQPDGKSVVGGQFVAYDSTNFNYLVRTLTNGLPDFSFGSGIGIIGPNSFVSAVAIDTSGRILIGGDFTSYNGILANHVARLNADGSLDTSFNTGRGANGTVFALALDPTGNVLMGGDFTAYDSTNRSHIARLIGNGPLAGSLDPTFDPGSGTDQPVRSVASDSLTNVVIGGSFSYVNGTNWPGLARLTASGALDTNFNPGTGVNGTVYSLAVQPGDNKIVFGGSFSQANLTNLNGIGRLNFNGSVDNNFSPGVGVNGPVYAVAIQPDQNILIGGQFTSVGTVRRIGYARLLSNGWVDTSFMDTSYNQFAGLINHYYNPYAVNPNDLPVPANYNTQNYVNALAVQPNGNVMIGGSFVRLGGGLKRDDVNFRWNLASVIGAPTLGPQGKDGGLGNQPGNLTFTQSTYSANDTIPSTFITVQRVNGSLGQINVFLSSNTLPPGPGAATDQDFGLNNSGFAQYTDPNLIIVNGYGWRECEAQYGPNNQTQLGGTEVPLQLNIVNNKAATQNLFSGLSLSVGDLDTFSLGGMVIPTYPAPGVSQATLEIIDDHQPAGTLGFSATNYNVVENAGFVTIPVLRTNGSSGSISVNYRTQNGFTNDPNVQTAIAGVDYIATNGTITFQNGSLSNGFQVQILNHSDLQSNKFFNVVLSNPTGGSGFDTNNPPILNTNSVVTIVDNHFQPGHLSFTSTAYSVTKGGAALIGVERTGGALGVISVQVVAVDGTGSNGVNYTAVSTNLQWTNSDVAVKYLVVPTLEDHVVEGTTTVNLYLTNADVANTGLSQPTNNLVLIFPTNAVLSIVDDDFYGVLNFSPTNINVLQNAGQVIVTVARSGGTVGTLSVNFATANPNAGSLVPPLQPALAGTNYVATNGTLTFGPGVTSQTFVVPILYTPGETNAANRVVDIILSNPNPSAITNGNPFPKVGSITILDNQLVTGAPGSVDTTLLTGSGFNGVVNSLSLQPDGKLVAGGLFTFCNQFPLNQIGRLNTDGSVDTGFLSQQAGSDGEIEMVLSQTPDPGQTNGSIMVAGNFAHIDNIPRNNIARLNLDGSLDETFNPGAGADNTVYSVVETKLAPTATNQSPLRAYIIGGSFVNYNGIQVNGVARLTSLGQVDVNFNPGDGVTSTNGTVHALAVQADGKVIVGGDFTSFNNFPYHHLVRLNLDGSVDNTFNVDTGGSVLGSVHAIAIQPNGQIVVGGVFTTVNGVSLNHIARLNADGTLDSGFNAGVGANNTVETLAIDSQGRILAGGQFTRASGVTRNALTRLNPDGTVDPTINFGAGANGYVKTIAIQANDEINLGGSFTTFGGIAQNNFTRLFGGEISGPGILNFVQAVFGVVQNQTNAIITIQRTGGTGNANFPVVSALFSTADGTALNGVDYIGVTNTVSFPIGETFTNVLVPIINSGVVGANKIVNLNLSSPVGASLGYQDSAQLIITNANAAVAFSSSSYRQSENVPGGAAVIPVVLIGNSVNTVSVTVYTGTNGNAVPGTDYLPTTNVLVFPPGVTTNLFLVPLLNSVNMLSDRTVDLEMTNAVGAFLTTPSSATLTIATVNAGPGVVAFSQPSYTVSEGASNAVITVIRTNGVTGPVSVTFETADGTALGGTNYQPINQVLNFSDGQSSQTVSIPIIQQATSSPDLTVMLILTNAVGTAIGGASVETLTIQNDIANFTVASPDYFISEGSGVVTISILRNGPANGTVSVGYTTVSPTNDYGTNGFAIPGLNYGPTNGILTFAPGQTFETIPIAVFQRNTVDGPETFQLVLTNASAGTQIGNPGAAVVTIIGDVTGFELATNSYVTGENGSNVVVTINRVNVNTGAVSVNYATGGGTAVPGVDYVAASGTLTFADGQASTNVVITIDDPGVLENNKTFNFVLSDPVSTIAGTNIYLLPPSSAVVTITNTVTGISFSSANYSVNEKGVQVQVTVARSGLTNMTSTVQFGTGDGTGVAGVNYFTTNGVLTFAPGVTSQTFSVNIIDDNKITADHTVILTLSNPQEAGGGEILLAPPSTATLTIQEGDGSFIVAAGTALVSEGFHPTNGLIDPGETVAVLFGLRDISGGNTTNLVATMQTNSGVTPGAINAQNYGTVVQGGHVVSEPFTFTANGTNNQSVNVVFQLQDGSRNLGTVVFSFSLGTTTTSFSNPGQIIITNLPAFGNNPTPAIPYPAPISVSGIPGSVGAVTVTISNLTHQLPSDIEMLLVSPATDVLLMNDVSGNSSFGVTNLTITFADSAATYLSSNRLVNNISTTNKPTAYVNDNGATVFVGNNWGFVPVMPTPAPANPYPTNLSVLSGTPANGTWSLYVADTETGDYGLISNGWILNLSTGNPVASYTDLELSVVPSPVNGTVSNRLTYSVTLTNYGPAAATDVILTNILPAGLTYLSNNFTGTVSSNNGVLTFATNGLAVGAGYSFNIYAVPDVAGLVTNMFAAISDQLEPSTNNTTNVVVAVSAPSADLGVTIGVVPSAVNAGYFGTILIVATNNGPSFAAATVVTNYLPAGLLLTGSSASVGSVSSSGGTNGGMNIWTIGSLAAGTNATLTLTFQAVAVNGATSLDTVVIASAVFDPFKLNNSDSAKIVINPAPTLAIVSSGQANTFTWPASDTNYVLQGATSLSPPIVWVTITSPAPTIVGGDYTVTVPTNGFHFFKLTTSQ